MVQSAFEYNDGKALMFKVPLPDKIYYYELQKILESTLMKNWQIVDLIQVILKSSSLNSVFPMNHEIKAIKRYHQHTVISSRAYFR